MRLRLRPIEIDEQHPYGNDRLFRREFGDALSNILKTAQGEFTLAIDGQWGDGKTTFAKMWCGQLKQEGFRAIYFDAFANDYGQDPFTPLVAVLLDAIRPDDVGSSEETKKKYASLGYQVLKLAGRVGLRAVTGGLIDEKDIVEIAKALNNDETDQAVGALHKRLGAYQLSENELNEFRSVLTELSRIGKEKLPLVIILDELDRCRPTFALSLLEKVKHFFSVDGIVFVFVMNSGQMCACIRHIYGEQIDARQYLHKFVDVECTLPTKNKTERQESLYRIYARYLLKAYALDQVMRHEDMKDCLMKLFENFGLSLRDMEKACRTVALHYAAHGEQSDLASDVVCLLAVLKVCDRNNYNALATGNKVSLEPILDKLVDSPKMEYLRAWVLACTGNEDMMDEGRRRHFQGTPSLWAHRNRYFAYHCARIDYFR